MAKATEQTIRDLFDDANEVKPRFMRWENVGDKCQGVLVEKRTVANRLKPGSHQVVYTLVEADGQKLFLSGRQGEPAVISGLEQVELGRECGVKFVALGQKQPGKHQAKILKVFKGEMKPDILEKFNNPLGAEMEAEEDKPF